VGFRENFLNYCCRYVTRQMCRTKTIEQHELFEHIIGIWRSAIIEDGILTSRLDVCQAERIRIILIRDVVIPFWDESPSATDTMLFIPAAYPFPTVVRLNSRVN